MGQFSFINVLFCISAICCIKYCSGYFCGFGSGTDRQCKVGFNYTRCKTNIFDKMYSNSTYLVCLNQSRYNPDGTPANNTVEMVKCWDKCKQEFLGYFQDGKFNLKNITNAVVTAYKLFSNATTAYAEKIAMLATKCAKDAENQLENKKSNFKDKLGSCEVNGLFGVCYSFLEYPLQRNWNATVEVCAAQGTTLKYEEEIKTKYAQYHYEFATTKRTSPIPKRISLSSTLNSAN